MQFFNLRNGGMKLALGLGVTVVTLLVAEVAVRSMHYAANIPVVHRVPHPSLGWHLEPGARIMYATDEFRVPVVYNSKGWRDAEHSYEKPSNTFRIVVLGDSFMEAYSVPFERSFAQQLESFVARPGTRVEVINLGVGGYGTLQQYLAFVEEGVKYHPDLVVLGFFTANDVSDNSLTIQQALRKKGSVKLRSRPFLDPSVPDQWRIIPPDFAAAQEAFSLARPRITGPAPVRFVKETALYGLLREARRSVALRQQNRPEAADEEDDGFNQKMDVYLCQEPPEYTEAWRLTERVFAKLADDVRASRAELMVFSVPSVPELNTQGRSDRFCVAQPPSSTRLPAIMARHNIPYVDLVGEFRQAHNKGVYLFWKSDGHWTPQGHEVAARRVAKELSKNHLARRPAAAKSTSAI